MGRYQPPRQRGSKYITAEGELALRAELHQLWKVERPTVADTVHEAAKNGDRSENGDYIYGKRRLREIDSRVRFLHKRLDEVEIVQRMPNDTSKIFSVPGCRWRVRRVRRRAGAWWDRMSST